MGSILKIKNAFLEVNELDFIPSSLVEVDGISYALSNWEIKFETINKFMRIGFPIYENIKEDNILSSEIFVFLFDENTFDVTYSNDTILNFFENVLSKKYEITLEDNCNFKIHKLRNDD